MHNILLIEKYTKIRKITEEICSSLEIEDYVIQTAFFVSPAKWHLGHTTWFFEQFILLAFKTDYTSFCEHFLTIFNSYYKTHGVHWVQEKRGDLSRPTVKQIYAYRNYINLQIEELLGREDLEHRSQILALLELGLEHEQQHQELLAMDIKFNFSNSPLNLTYANYYSPVKSEKNEAIQETKYIGLEGGLTYIGVDDCSNFFYDNEAPSHRCFIAPFKIRSTLVTNAEYLEFMHSGGYRSFEFWHSQGWDWVNNNSVNSPLYWKYHQKEGWLCYGPNGHMPLDLNAPVSHISFYEAFAFARWSNKRLPTEMEWEFAARQAKKNELIELFDMSNVLWQWTASAYLAYPGYKYNKDVLAEYNSKFMVGQMVLRGGCRATPIDHNRISYRNYFYPENRWMFSGIRLCEDI